MFGLTLALLLLTLTHTAHEHPPVVIKRPSISRIVRKHHHLPFRGMLRGLASWYDCCERTANGERLNLKAHTCAMLLWPIGTIVKIYDRATGRGSWCRVNDHGPYEYGRIIDLTPAVAKDLGLTGVDPVEVYKMR